MPKVTGIRLPGKYRRNFRAAGDQRNRAKQRGGGATDAL
jgi:hypothetical protein